MKLIALLITVACAGAIVGHSSISVSYRDGAIAAGLAALLGPLGYFGRVGLARLVALKLLAFAEKEESRQMRMRKRQRDGLRSLAEVGIEQ